MSSQIGSSPLIAETKSSLSSVKDDIRDFGKSSLLLASARSFVTRELWDMKMVLLRQSPRTLTLSLVYAIMSHISVLLCFCDASQPVEPLRETFVRGCTFFFCFSVAMSAAFLFESTLCGVVRHT